MTADHVRHRRAETRPEVTKGHPADARESVERRCEPSRQGELREQGAPQPLRVGLRRESFDRHRPEIRVAQVTAAVAALMIITSLTTTVNDFNAAETEPWRWSTTTDHWT